MDIARVYNETDMIAMLDHSANPLWLPPSSTPSFNETMVNFDQRMPPLGGRRRRSPNMEDRDRDQDRGSDDEFDMSVFNNQPGKKRRLTQEQVQYLERNFEVENKLEPERKAGLAKELGLQPRQVAIWFQNRRVRFKTKQLEKDYDSLKAGYDQLKLDYDSLLNEKNHLQNEVKMLTKKLMERDDIEIEDAPNSDPENPLDLEAHQPKTETQEGPKFDMTAGPVPGPGPISNKQTEDASSAKSDVVDSEAHIAWK